MPNFNPTAWHHVSLELNSDLISGSVDGEKLATVTDQSGARGMAFLASSYDRNLFDNVRVSPLRGTGKANPQKANHDGQPQ